MLIALKAETCTSSGVSSVCCSTQGRGSNNRLLVSTSPEPREEGRKRRTGVCYKNGKNTKERFVSLFRLSLTGCIRQGKDALRVRILDGHTFAYVILGKVKSKVFAAASFDAFFDEKNPGW